MKTLHLKKCLPYLVMFAAQAIFISAYAADTDSNRGQLSSSDYKFACAAARGGMMEVNAGNIAAANSSNPGIQQFGQKMVTDHGKAGDELKQLASNKGATLPTSLTAKQQREIDHLTKKTGASFDKAYMTAMVRDHKMDEKAFKHATETVQDPDLKAWANTTLAIVENHLSMAEDLDKTAKQENASTDAAAK